MANMSKTDWTISPSVGAFHGWTTPSVGGPVASLQSGIDFQIIADEPSLNERVMSGLSRAAGIATLGGGLLGLMALMTPLI